MTPKMQALLSAVISGLTGFIGFLANTPPEQQAQVLGLLVEAIPLHWRPDVAIAASTVSKVLAVYSIYKAAQSGPQQPPRPPSRLIP